jgi:hypothetical protein
MVYGIKMDAYEFKIVEYPSGDEYPYILDGTGTVEDTVANIESYLMEDYYITGLNKSRDELIKNIKWHIKFSTSYDNWVPISIIWSESNQSWDRT